MRLDSRRLVPALVEFPGGEREPGWGRLLELGAAGARLATRLRLERGERVALSFELPGEALGGLSAEVRRARLDEEGYTVAELSFPGSQARLRLGRALLRLASRSPER